LTWPRVAKALRLRGDEVGNVQVRCPLHDDRSASASVNFEKGLFHCFSGCGGLTLDQLEERMPEVQPEVGKLGRPPRWEGPVFSEDELVDRATSYLAERGFSEPDGLGVEVDVVADPTSEYYGYLIFESGGQIVARNLLEETDSRPRYRNSKGGKKLFWVGQDNPARPVWLVEGVFDALALHQLGVVPVAALLSCDLTDQQAYHLRRRTVFVLLDADQAGYAGAKKVVEKLREYEANGLIVELPMELGEDPGEAFQKHHDEFAAFLQRTQAELGATDEAYVDGLFGGQERSLQILPSGIPTWDALLGGGFKDGVHTIVAETSVGKTAFALRCATAWADLLGKRVLYVTYEISKKQAWSRVASCFTPEPWDVIEQTPAVVSKAVRQRVRSLAQHIRVAVGWDAGKIAYALPRFDAVIIDYLQRMPGPYGSGENAQRANIKHNIARLSDMARDSGKVMLVISSAPRSSYGEVALPKESGDIEFVSQSMASLQAGSAGLVIGTVTKNTRGVKGAFWMRTDLGHLEFHETKPKGA
jgi:hypothetical protein